MTVASQKMLCNEGVAQATIRNFLIVQADGARQGKRLMDQFTEKRRRHAQQQAEQQYIEALKCTAETLKCQRKQDERK